MFMVHVIPAKLPDGYRLIPALVQSDKEKHCLRKWVMWMYRWLVDPRDDRPWFWSEYHCNREKRGVVYHWSYETCLALAFLDCKVTVNFLIFLEDSFKNP